MVVDSEFEKQWQNAGRPRPVIWADHLGGLLKTVLYMLYFDVYVRVREWYYGRWAKRLNKGVWLPANYPTRDLLKVAEGLFKRYAPPGSVLTIRPPVDRAGSTLSVHARYHNAPRFTQESTWYAPWPYSDRNWGTGLLEPARFKDEEFADVSLIQTTDRFTADFKAWVIAVALRLGTSPRPPRKEQQHAI